MITTKLITALLLLLLVACANSAPLAQILRGQIAAPTTSAAHKGTLGTGESCNADSDCASTCCRSAGYRYRLCVEKLESIVNLPFIGKKNYVRCPPPN